MKALLKIPKLPPPTLPEEGPRGFFGKKIVSFIECCLKPDPSDRPTAADLLKHPFIKVCVCDEGSVAKCCFLLVS